jgi:predicted HicB family RNase H-like nuclease
MTNPEHYTYRVIWSEADQEYIGLCAELPNLSFLDKDQVKALKGINHLAKDVVNDLIANHEPVPLPIAEQPYSGKFLVRIPPELHRLLVIKSTEAGISLNRYISTKLALSA